MLNLDNAVTYHYGKFPPQQLEYTKFISQLLNATSALARYDQCLKSMKNSEILLAPLRNQEAVISSRMEGTISTMDEILQYEADYGDSEQYSSEVRMDVIETILYQRTLKNAQRAISQGYPLSKSMIKTMHQQLLSYGRGANKSPGYFKNEQNYIADTGRKNILFVPISSIDLESGLDNLFNYINTSEDPELVKTAITHLEFEALHPFKDGNGRIGRMLITLMLWSSKQISAPHFYISGYLEDNKNIYIDMMRNVSKTGNWDDWCGFFIKAIEEQAIKNLAISENIQNLYEQMKIELTNILSSKWTVNVLDFIFTNPVFRNKNFTSKSGIPTGTANKIISTLVANDILVLKDKASGQRSALYSFERLMKLVRV
ncbi:MULTISPECIES: Fic family protein [Pasteurellaceae]|uniref:Fic family protein n=1 Tax=Pasteurellaceae TaxID=712 RepID=UPI003569928E